MVKKIPKDYIELEYTNLTFEYWYICSPATGMSGPWYLSSPDEYDSIEITKDWTYKADRNDVIQCIYNIMKGKEELSIDESNDLWQLVCENLDDLLEKYYDEILDCFEGEAKEDASENYDPDDNYED